MNTIGEITKISENKYIWTVSGSGCSPSFWLNDCEVRMCLQTMTPQITTWDVSVILDPKLPPTTSVIIVIKIMLKSGILFRTDNYNLHSSVGEIDPNQRTASVISTTFGKSLINEESPLQIECEFLNLSVEPLVQIMPKPILAPVLDEKNKEFKKLFESRDFTDVTIISRGVELRVHKHILSARSKVFAAMFKDCFKESEKSTIEIDDIDGDIMEEVIKFIYIGEVTDIDKLAFELVAPADKYEIEGLLPLCEKALIKAISLDNIKPMLSLLNLYDLPLLKSATFNLLKNYPKFVKSSDLNEFLKKLSPSLLSEIIIYVV